MKVQGRLAPIDVVGVHVVEQPGTAYSFELRTRFSDPSPVRSPSGLRLIARFVRVKHELLLPEKSLHLVNPIEMMPAEIHGDDEGCA